MRENANPSRPADDDAGTPSAPSRLPAADAERTEPACGERFDFGENWTRFLATIDERRIAAAEDSLRAMLECSDLEGRLFLDVGSGSGLFSLAARRLGAYVVSFDCDPRAVACTKALADRYRPGDEHWTIEHGSALDAGYLKGLGRFDVVYSWGVLHHTGHLWKALGNVERNVAPAGKLCIALYNRQPVASRYWSAVKRAYNRSAALRPVLVAVHLAYPFLPSVALRWLQGRRPECVARPDKLARWISV